MRQFPGHGMGSMFAGFLGFVGTLTFLGLLALLIIFLVRRSKSHKMGDARPFAGPGHHHRAPMPPAMQLLDDRLARGEIEIDDYLNRRAAMLGETSQPNEWVPGTPDANPAATPPKPEPGRPGGEDPQI